jgi:hypothetical protein
MRQFFAFALGAVALCAAAHGASAEQKIRLAQTSNTTNCMMICNSAAANCRTTCVLPGNLPTTTAAAANIVTNAGTTNAGPSVACLLNCSTTELGCHTACGQQSPSR